MARIIDYFNAQNPEKKDFERKQFMKRTLLTVGVAIKYGDPLEPVHTTQRLIRKGHMDLIEGVLRLYKLASSDSLNVQYVKSRITPVSEMVYAQVKEKGSEMIPKPRRYFQKVSLEISRGVAGPFLDTVKQYSPQIEETVIKQTGNPEFFSQDRLIKQVMQALKGE